MRLGKTKSVTSLILAILMVATLVNVPAFTLKVKADPGDTFSDAGIKYKVVAADKVEVIEGGDYSGIVTIPAKVNSSGKEYDVIGIGVSAFRQETALTKVNIPDSVTYIGYDAFTESGLQEIEIPDSVTSIGTFAFYCITSLTKVKYSSNLTIIPKKAFGGCSNLTEITNIGGVTSIGEQAFSDCTKLTSISLPDGVKTIEYYAFGDCSSLKNINMPADLEEIGDGAFKNCNDSDFCKDIVFPDKLKTIGEQAFYDCKYVENLTIPASVTSIGEKAFGCDDTTNPCRYRSITFEGVNPPTMGSNVFPSLYYYGFPTVTVPEVAKEQYEELLESYSGITVVGDPSLNPKKEDPKAEDNDDKSSNVKKSEKKEDEGTTSSEPSCAEVIEQTEMQIRTVSDRIKRGELKGPQTIYLDKGKALPRSTIKLLEANKNITLDFKYRYNGRNYHAEVNGKKHTLPDNVQVAGPYYIYQYYGVDVH